MNAPTVTCDCGEIMVLIEQEHKENKIIKIRYTCTCGNSAMALVNEFDNYVYIYDKDSNLLRYYYNKNV